MQLLNMLVMEVKYNYYFFICFIEVLGLLSDIRLLVLIPIY